MHNETKHDNDMPASVDGASASIAMLNARLADALDLKLIVKQAHWNIRGPSFIGIHLLLDKVAERIEEHTDTLAERIVQLGGRAHGTSQAIAQATTLEVYPVDMVQQTDHLEALTARFKAFGKACRAAINEADEADDDDTADIFTGLSRAIEKDLWFISAHLG